MKDIEDYGRSVPAGIRFESTDMRRVLSAAADDGETIYRTTVAKVIEFLADLRSNNVERHIRRGKSSVVFSNDIVERLKRDSVCCGPEARGLLRAG